MHPPNEAGPPLSQAIDSMRASFDGLLAQTASQRLLRFAGLAAAPPASGSSRSFQQADLRRLPSGGLDGQGSGVAGAALDRHFEQLACTAGLFDCPHALLLPSALPLDPDGAQRLHELGAWLCYGLVHGHKLRIRLSSVVFAACSSHALLAHRILPTLEHCMDAARAFDPALAASLDALLGRPAARPFACEVAGVAWLVDDASKRAWALAFLRDLLVARRLPALCAVQRGFRAAAPAALLGTLDQCSRASPGVLRCALEHGARGGARLEMPPLKDPSLGHLAAGHAPPLAQPSGPHVVPQRTERRLREAAAG